jgi:flagellar basal-body rod protein FlgF
MSIKGIYTAVSGAMAQSDKLDTIANNIANVDTPAFKRDQQVFKEYLTSAEKAPEVIEAPRMPASIDSFFPLNGNDKSFVDSAGTSTNFEQGTLKITENAFDLAVEGDGFFEVLTPNGLRFTRNGAFTLNSQGDLVTKQGYPVLQPGTAGGAVQDRFIKVGDANTWTVTPEGEMMIDNQPAGQISVITAKDKNAFHKEGNSLYKLRENIALTTIPATQFKVHQGAIEKSNVNLVSEMTDMIKTTRVFETTQKAIQAYDQMNAKLVNDVTRLK